MVDLAIKKIGGSFHSFLYVYHRQGKKIHLLMEDSATALPRMAWAPGPLTLMGSRSAMACSKYLFSGSLAWKVEINVMEHIVLSKPWPIEIYI